MITIGVCVRKTSTCVQFVEFNFCTKHH